MALVALAGAEPVKAQFGVGGGPIFVLEGGGGTDFQLMATGAFGGSADRPVGFRVDGMWHFADNGNIISGTGNVVYKFAVSEAARFRPYLIGGVGIYHADPDDPGIPGVRVASSTDFGINAGAGFMVPLGQGNTRLFGEARFHSIFEGDNVNLLPITIGVMFGS